MMERHKKSLLRAESLKEIFSEKENKKMKKNFFSTF